MFKFLVDLMCVKFRPAWADKGGIFRQVACVWRHALLSGALVPHLQAQRNQVMREPTPTPFCPGKRGRRIGLLLHQPLPFLRFLRSRTHSVYN